MSWDGGRRFGDIKPIKGDRLVYANNLHLIYQHYDYVSDLLLCLVEKTSESFLVTSFDLYTKRVVNVTQENWEFDNCPVQTMFKKINEIQEANNE